MTPLPLAQPELSSDERIAARARLCVALDLDLAERPVVGDRTRQAVLDPHVRAVIDLPLNHHGDTALHKAVRSSRGLNVIQVLLSNGANPDVRDTMGEGRTAVLLCLDEVVPTTHLIALLDAGANPNVPGPTGDNALGRLLHSGDTPEPDLLQRLLDSGADCHQANHQGITPMTMAIDNGMAWVVEAFVAHEAKQLQGVATHANDSGSRVATHANDSGSRVATHANDSGSRVPARSRL